MLMHRMLRREKKNFPLYRNGFPDLLVAEIFLSKTNLNKIDATRRQNVTLYELNFYYTPSYNIFYYYYTTEVRLIYTIDCE